MATVQEIYDVVCDDLMEPGGLVLGILTEADFIRLLTSTIVDFLKQTALIKRVYTQTVFAGIRQYAVPTDITRVDEVFLQGRYLQQADVEQLSGYHRNWRRELVQNPRFWHQDGLPLITVGTETFQALEIAPGPVYNGSYIIGAAEPDPPHAQYDTFTAIVNVNGSNVVQTAPVHRGLTIIGPRKPNAVTALGNNIPLIPNDFALAYLAFGVLERIFEGDNELRDQQRALYCKSQYEEGIYLGKEISGEFDEE